MKYGDRALFPAPNSSAALSLDESVMELKCEEAIESGK